jgi:hypothetical protein
MAHTTGYVQRLAWLRGPPTACVSVGSATSQELLFVQIRPPDSSATAAFKRAIVGLLARAQCTGCEISVAHPDQSAEISSVSTLLPNPGARPLQFDALEVTQAIQDLSQSVPLVARKRTVIRLCLSDHGPQALTVRGELALRRGPADPTLILPSLNTTVLDPGQAGNVPTARADAARTLNFVVPDSHTGVGPLAVSIANITDVVTGNVVAVGSERRPTFWFHAGSPLRVRVLGMRYAQGSPPVTHVPANLDFQMLLSWLGRAYPVSQVVSSTAIVDATAAAPFGCGDINAQLAATRALDMSSGGDRRTHYYGLVSDGGFFMRGCAAGIPSSPDPGTVACGPTGPATWGWDFDGSYGDWYGGHELGHTFGRLHPGFCGETQDDLARYPFANGQLADSSAGFVGFDVGDPILNLPLAALPGPQWHDVMTYCDFQWLSVYTYGGVRQRLLAEAALPASVGAGSSSSGAGGRPDQRYPPPIRVERRLPHEPDGERAISVVGTANLTQRSGTIRYVHPVSATGLSGVADRESPVVLRVVGPGPEPAREYPLAIKLNSELSPQDDRVGLIDAVILVPPTAVALELALAGEVVDTFESTVEPPDIRAIRPLATRGDDLVLSVHLGQPLARAHTYAVQVSTDRSRSWQTVAVGLREPTFTLDRSQFEPGDEVELRIIATNGFTSREVRHAVRI